MDDSQDKVRRNLVVFSFIVIAGWFLKIAPTDFQKLISPLSIHVVESDRFWIVVFSVLTYLSLRFRFDSKTMSDISALRSEFTTKRMHYLHQYLTTKVSRINRSGKFPSVFSNSLEEEVAQNMARHFSSGNQNIGFKLFIVDPWGKSQLPIEFDQNDPWHGNLSITQYYFDKSTGNDFQSISGTTYEFSIPTQGRYWIQLHSIIHAFSYSQSALTLIFPSVLAFSAFLIIISKLGNSFFH